MYSENKIDDLCAKIDKSFFIILERKPFDAALLLGNLYYAIQNATPKNRATLSQTLKKFKNKLNAHRVSTLWYEIRKLSQARMRVMDNATYQSCRALLRGFVRDVELFKYIDNHSLIELAQNISWVRDVMIALIRKHLLRLKHYDPFSEDFSYELLHQASNEKNYLYLSGIIKKCADLPLDEIIFIGKNSARIAQLILKNMFDSECYFEISSSFAQYHPTLRQSIADDWEFYLDTFPLSHEKKRMVKKELEKLKSQFPEFAKMPPTARVNRDYAQVNWEISPRLFDSLQFGVSAPIACYLAPNLYLHGSSIISLASALATGSSVSIAAGVFFSTAIPVVIPFAAFAGISWMSERWFKSHGKLKQTSSPIESTDYSFPILKRFLA